MIKIISWFDLLTKAEDLNYDNRFNIESINTAVGSGYEMLTKDPVAETLPVGYFGASTGTASALGTAAAPGQQVKAVVSRGGRPDLAMAVLPKVRCPTLLIVGGLDQQVIEFNRKAFLELLC